MKNFILIAFIGLSLGSHASEIHQLAKFGTVFDMNIRLSQIPADLNLFDRADEHGLTVWDYARQNANPEHMTSLLEAFHLEFNQRAFEPGIADLPPAEEYFDAPVDQFEFDEELHAQRFYNHFWGIEGQGQPEHVVNRQNLNLGPAPIRFIGFSFSPSTSSSQ